MTPKALACVYCCGRGVDQWHSICAPCLDSRVRGTSRALLELGLNEHYATILREPPKRTRPIMTADPLTPTETITVHQYDIATGKPDSARVTSTWFLVSAPYCEPEWVTDDPDFGQDDIPMDRVERTVRVNRPAIMWGSERELWEEIIATIEQHLFPICEGCGFPIRAQMVTEPSDGSSWHQSCHEDMLESAEEHVALADASEV
jgi:hypothetical protein